MGYKQLSLQSIVSHTENFLDRDIINRELLQQDRKKKEEASDIDRFAESDS
jgi:hypothetical protein